MVRWYHLIMTAHGFWLPNDPRGSWSEFVGAWELYKFGGATKTSETRSLAHEPHDRVARRAAKAALTYPAVRFNEHQRRLVADGFKQAVREGRYQLHALCIGHDHSHAVVGRHVRTIERIAGHLKSKATMALTRADVHPLRAFRTPAGVMPSPWSEGVWSVYINEEEHLRDAMEYVRRHPIKEGLSAQHYSFLVAAPV